MFYIIILDIFHHFYYNLSLIFMQDFFTLTLSIEPIYHTNFRAQATVPLTITIIGSILNVGVRKEPTKLI